MSNPRNPWWGYWAIDWDDPREVADAMGEGCYKIRRTQWEPMEEHLSYGFHLEADNGDNEPWER